MTKKRKINAFLKANRLWIRENPAVSPDLVVDVEPLFQAVKKNSKELVKLVQVKKIGVVPEVLRGLMFHSSSRLDLSGTAYHLVESPLNGDAALVAWHDAHLLTQQKDLKKAGHAFEEARWIKDEDGALEFVPLIWENLIHLKNRVLHEDPQSTLFPKAVAPLDRTSLGIGARFTTLHWPAVAWVMGAAKLPLTANQNSIPRELVYDTDAMLGKKLQSVPFPFIGGSVPEGHQGQSVQGMTHAQIISFLKYGFHHQRIPYGFNADHQPIGGRFDKIEDKLVEGSLFASYITFDLSPELSKTKLIEDPKKVDKAFKKSVGNAVLAGIQKKLSSLKIKVDEKELKKILVYLEPSMGKLKKRDDKYKKIREKLFTSPVGRAYFRELSIDELPGQTSVDTLAACLAYADSLGLNFQFVAPNIGFQKNLPYSDNAELEEKVKALYAVAEKFGVSFGFHSGSGKSAENYQVLGRVTGGKLEIKTSGRYTYEMGKALSMSSQGPDQKLWKDWYAFAKMIALDGAFAKNEVQRKFARDFIDQTLALAKIDRPNRYDKRATLQKIVDGLTPSPEHMFWFEYNFLFVLAAGGLPKKLGDHTKAGYIQRSRFYKISDEAKFHYARQVARYILFLAENTGIAPQSQLLAARTRLESYHGYSELLRDISP
ncbi:MAG: hypothetical protein JNM63_11735 [Spirochaetia bacterium]|nr:hypothetical protein [Spirochaetia bacterium]